MPSAGRSCPVLLRAARQDGYALYRFGSKMVGIRRLIPR